MQHWHPLMETYRLESKANHFYIYEFCLVCVGHIIYQPELNSIIVAMGIDLDALVWRLCNIGCPKELDGMDHMGIKLYIYKNISIIRWLNTVNTMT